MGFQCLVFLPKASTMNFQSSVGIGINPPTSSMMQEGFPFVLDHSSRSPIVNPKTNTYLCLRDSFSLNFLSTFFSLFVLVSLSRREDAKGFYSALESTISSKGRQSLIQQ